MYRGKFERSTPVPQKRKQAPRLGSLIFWLVFLTVLLLFWGGVYLGLNALQLWLCNYEAAQPDTVGQKVFEALFEDPDWGALYDRADQEEGLWEGKDAFVSVMERKVGDAALGYMSTSAGLSGDQKYIVTLGRDKIAAFTLRDTSGAKDQTELPQWRLDKLEFYVQGAECYRIRAPQNCSVTVNGRELGQEHMVMLHTPAVQEYLPVGLEAPGECTWQIDGLLAQPEIRIVDEAGEELPVAYDPDSCSFTAERKIPEIGSEERERALKAVRTYALYMIKRAGGGELAKYFNTSSDTYRAITGAQLSFVQDAAKREFTEESVTEYCRYGEHLFSARVSLNLKLYRSDGSVKDNPIDQTLFFSREPGGNWMCYAMTAVDVSEQKDQVRLTFCQGDRILQSEFHDADSETILCPRPEIPEGKIFAGWYVEETDAQGKPVLRLVLHPDETGTAVYDEKLEPMRLYPLFE